MRTAPTRRPSHSLHDGDPPTAREWWGARRGPYNLALLAAGALAFGCYLAALEIRCADTSGVEVTLFTIFFQGVGYLVAVGLANVCYQLGPGLERVVPSGARTRYRQWAFRAGLGFSVVLPFLIPLAVLVTGCAPGEP